MAKISSREILLPSNILKLRDKENLTQTEFGQRFGLVKQTVGNMEKGRNMPSVKLLVQIADYYGLTLDELLFGEHLESIDDRVDELSEIYRKLDELKADTEKLLGINNKTSKK